MDCRRITEYNCKISRQKTALADTLKHTQAVHSASRIQLQCQFWQAFGDPILCAYQIDINVQIYYGCCKCHRDMLDKLNRGSK